MNSGKRGARGELLVCADLLARGFDVYRAVSQSSDCDLVIVRGRDILRVEVRTAYQRKDGELTGVYADPKKADVLAKVSKDGTLIYYDPALRELNPVDV